MWQSQKNPGGLSVHGEAEQSTRVDVKSRPRIVALLFEHLVRKDDYGRCDASAAQILRRRLSPDVPKLGQACSSRWHLPFLSDF